MRTGVLLLLPIAAAFLTDDICPPRWEYVHQTHSCYLRASLTLPWEEAETFCNERGEDSHLATILSSQEMEAVHWMVDEFLTWIGLRITPEKLWSDGTPVNFTNFLPDTGGLQEGPCVVWHANDEQNGWRHIACNYSQFFVCKKKAAGSAPSFQHGDSGRFNSPGFPAAYPNNITWHHIIETEPGNKIEITFTHVDLEYWRDFVEVVDIGDKNPISLGRLTGQIYDRGMISRSHKVDVIFKSDEDFTAAGFHAHWRSRTYESSLPAMITHEEKEAEIKSLSYPGPIERFIVQRHLIKCPPENHVIIELKECVLSEQDFLRFFQEPRGDILLPHFSGISEPMEFATTEPTVFVKYDGIDGEKWSQRWRFTYYCQRDDGLGDEIIIL